jgi:hypothetical protein
MLRKKALIRPGMNVDCVVRMSDGDKSVDVRRSKVLDMDEKKMIISQTTPAILPSFYGNRIVVTYVNHNQYTRMGLSGKVLRIVDDYRLSSAEKAGAIILGDLSEEKQYNLRFGYRVRPPEGFDLTLLNDQKERLKVIDISALGVRFSHGKTREYNVGQEIKLYLGYDKAFYELKARVVRKEANGGGKGDKIEYVAMQFLDLDYRKEEELHKIVRGIDLQKNPKRLFA